MNWDRIEGQWKQSRGKTTRHWGKLMNDELAAISGRYEELVGKLQEKYGLAKEESKQEVDEFKKTVKLLRQSNSKLSKLVVSLQKRERSDRKPPKARTSSGNNPRRSTTRKPKGSSS